LLRLLLCAFSLLLVDAVAAAAIAQSAPGQELFLKNCTTCHSLANDGVRRAGPHLDQIFGRRVGALDGFPYSEALKGAGFAWDADRLDGWLTNPQAFLPGTYMLYRQDDPVIRREIIDYLRAAASSGGTGS